MSDRSKQDRIRELEAELAELRGEPPKPLTLAEIRAMSKEEVDANWERVQASLAAAQEPSPTTAAPAKHEPPEPVGVDRMAAAYAQSAKEGSGS